MKRTNPPYNKKFPLTPEEQCFVNQYIVDQLPVEALKRSKIIKPYVSKKEYPKIAKDLLSNPTVQDSINKALQDKVRRLKTTEDAVIAQISRMAFTDASQLYDDDGNIKPIKELPYDVRCSIQSVKVKSIFHREDGQTRQIGTTTEVKINNQLDALKTILEKIVYKEQREAQTIINNYNNTHNTHNTHNTINQTNNKTINVKDLSQEQVGLLLQLKGYQQTSLGYQPVDNKNDNESNLYNQASGDV